MIFYDPDVPMMTAPPPQQQQQQQQYMQHSNPVHQPNPALLPRQPQAPHPSHSGSYHAGSNGQHAMRTAGSHHGKGAGGYVNIAPRVSSAMLMGMVHHNPGEPYDVQHHARSGTLPSGVYWYPGQKPGGDWELEHRLGVVLQVCVASR